MPMLAKDIKNGTVVNYNDAPCIIETISVQSPSARGAATIYKYRARNLVTKQKIDIVLRGGESLDEANFERRPVKFMYADATHMHFLDQEDYNQYALPAGGRRNTRPSSSPRDLEGVQAMIYNDECVGLQLPVAVELKVTQCDPGVQGNSATGRTKPATLRDRPDRASARVPGRGRNGQGRHANRRVLSRSCEGRSSRRALALCPSHRVARVARRRIKAPRLAAPPDHDPAGQRLVGDQFAPRRRRSRRASSAPRARPVRDAVRA